MRKKRGPTYRADSSVSRRDHTLLDLAFTLICTAIFNIDTLLITIQNL